MSTEPPDPPIQNPVRGTTVDTSPQTLGLDQPDNASETETSVSQTRSRTAGLPRSVMKRVEQTAAKLGSTVLGSGPGSNAAPRRENSSSVTTQREKQQSHPSSGESSGRLTMSLGSVSPRRFLSLSRKGKEREHSGYPAGASSFLSSCSAAFIVNAALC